MSHHYRVPPGVTGGINGTEPFNAETAIAAVDAKRKKCANDGQWLVADRVSVFNMQVMCCRQWMPVVVVNIAHGGMRARGGR